MCVQAYNGFFINGISEFINIHEHFLHAGRHVYEEKLITHAQQMFMTC